MKITDNTASIFCSVPFSTLRRGDTFKRTDRTDDFVLMRIEPCKVCGTDCNAVSLNGELTFIQADRLVYPVEGEFVCHLVRTDREVEE